MTRIGLYARVSTSNGQDPESQLLALREYAAARKLTVFREYVDTISGSTDSRPALDALMKDASRRHIDAVVVWKFDRWARSTRHLILSLEEFQHLGIDFISLSESVDTSTPMGKMVFVVLGAVAELERSLIRERVMLGLQRAKAQGVKLGRRPDGPPVDAEAVRRLRIKGMGLRAIAQELGSSKSTIHRTLADMEL